MRHGGVITMSAFMQPSRYAARYLPVPVTSTATPYAIRVDRYHIGAPTSAKDALWGAVGDYFARNGKGSRSAFLEVVIDRTTHLVGSREYIRQAILNPFWGKGSPEDCQVCLQLAARLGVVTDGRLQAWADANIGLDCNGFVGNYLFHEVMGRDWRTVARKNIDPGPSAAIDTIFDWVLKRGATAVTDIAAIDPNQIHVIVRVDAGGKVIPGGPAALAAGNVGHIALSEAGVSMAKSFVSNSMGGLDLASAQRGLYGKFALRTVESAGEKSKGIAWGVHENWMVFQRPVKGQPGVFEVQRDRINKLDRVRLAPLVSLA